MVFNKLKENIKINIENKINKVNDNDLLNEIYSRYTCPYCEYNVKELIKYNTCVNCNNNYRIYNNKVYKDEETINDILYYFIKIITHMSNVDGFISNEKLDYVYYIVKEEVKLDLNKIKWCAIIFKETTSEKYTSEVINKFNKSLKKYYGYNYNIERLSFFKWLVNLYNMNQIIYDNQKRILKDYMDIFNIDETDYIYINYPEVSISKE